MRKIFWLSLILAAGCSFDRSAIPSYKLTVPQGNVLDERAVAVLSTGMTANQVRSLLGTPQLLDLFHQNRWDYPFLVMRAGEVKEKSHLTLYFDSQGILTKIERPEAENPPEAAPAQSEPTEKGKAPAAETRQAEKPEQSDKEKS